MHNKVDPAAFCEQNHYKTQNRPESFAGTSRKCVISNAICNLWPFKHYVTVLVDIAQKKMDEEKRELQGSISMTKGLRYQGLLAFS